MYIQPSPVEGICCKRVNVRIIKLENEGKWVVGAQGKRENGVCVCGGGGGGRIISLLDSR